VLRPGLISTYTFTGEALASSYSDFLYTITQSGIVTRKFVRVKGFRVGNMDCKNVRL
jgi:hypothetical protein